MQPLFAEFTSGTTSDRWQVCLADCQDHLTFDALADILYTEYPRMLEQTDVLIVRPRVDLPCPPKSIIPSEFALLAKRAPHASLHVLSSEAFEVALSPNLNPGLEDKLSTAELRSECVNWLRDKELYTFLTQSRALFQAHSKFVYRAPSKRYVNMFLRVGNVQRTRQVLDAFFFWMLPHLRDRAGLLTDTWSISSIALNAGRLLERYWAAGETSETGSLLRNECYIDMLSSYPDDLLPVLPETQDILRRVSGSGHRKVLILISAVATGTSLRHLRNAVAQAQMKEGDFTFLSLYKLEDTPEIPHLCDISDGVGGMKFTPIQREQIQDRTVIEIDRSAYFPLEIRETPLFIEKKHAMPAKEFFDVYQQPGVVSVHRDSVDLSNQELRHHAIYLDVLSMIHHERFAARFVEAVHGIQSKPFIVVAPPHAAGKAMSDMAQRVLEERWGERSQIFITPDLRAVDDTLSTAIKNATTDAELIVIDDVSVTGHRLARYQQSLRELGFQGHINYIVGIARPESEKNWERRVRELKYRSGTGTQHNVSALEKVVLPDWDGRTCPWCVESRSLARLFEQGRLGEHASSEVMRRIMRLEGSPAESGLVRDAIWTPSGKRKLDLTINSVFLDVQSDQCTESSVIAAVGAAIQQMRNVRSDDARLEATYPHVTVLSPDNYFAERFNDDLLRLAIIRMSKAAELELWNDGDEEKRRESVGRFLYDKPDSQTFMLELAVARLSRKIPQPLLPDRSTDEVFWGEELWRAFVDV